MSGAMEAGPVATRGQLAARGSNPPWWRDRLVLESVGSGLLLGCGWGLQLLAAGKAGIVLLALGIVLGGHRFARESLEGLWKERQASIALLMSLSVLGAAALGDWTSAGMVAFLYSLAEALEHRTIDRARRSIESLLELAPKQATVLRGEDRVTLAAEQLVAGDLLLVAPGEALATDGIIRAGRSTLVEAIVTGESLPVEKGPGDSVFAGTTNGEGALEVEATKAHADNTVAHIVRLVEEAEASRGKTQTAIERFARVYCPVVILAAFLLFLIPTLAGGVGGYWAERAITLLVAASPCALVIATPVTMIAALGRAARMGLIVKGGLHLETLGTVRAMAFDKTGTLTRGCPVVIEAAALSGQPIEALLPIAAGVEQASTHPLARAILRCTLERGLKPRTASEHVAILGKGVQAVVDGQSYTVGSADFFRERGLLNTAATVADRVIAKLRGPGRTLALLADERHLLAVFVISDEVRAGSREALSELRANGVLHLLLLTGDHRDAAEGVAALVGISEVSASLMPAGKIEAIRRHLASYGTVAMVGDGVNDAPALAAASVGIAMGAAGSDLAIQTADIALMGEDLRVLARGVALARQTLVILRQNVIFSVFIGLALIVSTFSGHLFLTAAVIAHEASELLVIVNGIRLTRFA